MFRPTYIATTSPNTGHDISQGFNVGMYWWNKILGHMYICESAKPGAAVWELVNKANTVISDKKYIDPSDVDSLGTAKVIVETPDGFSVNLTDLLIEFNISTQLDVGAQDIEIKYSGGELIATIPNAKIPTSDKTIKVTEFESCHGFERNEDIVIVLSDGVDPSSGAASLDITPLFTLIQDEP